MQMRQFRWTVVVLLSVALGYALLTGGVITYPDSSTYLLTGRDAVGKLSFVGNAIRAWPTVLLFSGGPRLGVIAQYLLFGYSVYRLAYVVARLLRPWLGYLTVGLVIVFLLGAQTIQWNSAVLSESVTNSLVLLSLGYGLEFMILRRSLSRGVFGIICGTLAFVNRPTLVLLPMLLGFACLLGLRGQYKFWWKSVLVIFLTLAASSYGIFVNSNINSYWSRGSAGFTRSSVNFSFITAANTGAIEPDQLFSALGRDPSVPRCLTSIRADYSNSPFAFQQVLRDTCGSDVEWINTRFQSWYLRFQIDNPKYVLGIIRDRLDGSENARTIYARPLSVIPTTLESLFLGPSDRETRYSPVVTLVSLATVLSLVVIWRRPKCNGTGRHLTQGLTYLTLTQIAGLSSLVLSHLQMNAEIERISVSSNLLVVASAIVAIAICTDYLISKQPE